MAMHIRSGDMVVVTAGKSAWKRTPDGKRYRDLTPRKVLRVMANEGRCIVEGVNVRRKAVKPSQANQQGGLIDQEMPIHLSNVSPVDKEGKPTRVRFVTADDGTKTRNAATTGEQLGDVIKKAR